MVTSDGIDNLIRPELADFGGYETGKSPETLEDRVEVPVENIIKLDANENPYGCSPKVLQAMSEYKGWYAYPDSGQTRLRQQLHEYTGADAGNIVAACCSDELLDDIMRLFIEPGDEVINCIPTFDMYRIRSVINRAKLVNVPRDENYDIDISKIKAAVTPRTKIIILANPNSPTGTASPQKDILELVNTGVPVLVDEAYYEFYGETIAPLVKEYQNLMVLRTFSKWAGLAGLRVGYGIFPPKIAGFLMQIKLPYNVNIAAMVAVRETLRDIDYLTDRVKAIVAERERLSEQLKSLKGLKPFPSQANFIFCSVLNGKAAKVQQRLQEKGILVRYFDQPLLQSSLRISVGKPEHTDTLIKALQELEEEING